MGGQRWFNKRDNEDDDEDDTIVTTLEAAFQAGTNPSADNENTD